MPRTLLPRSGPWFLCLRGKVCAKQRCRLTRLLILHASQLGASSGQYFERYIATVQRSEVDVPWQEKVRVDTAAASPRAWKFQHGCRRHVLCARQL